jgi:acyl-CoA synthetase (AMP-forming)/AMP-acid ligase II
VGVATLSARDVVTLAELPRVVGRHHGTKIALVIDEQSLTYDGLERAANRVAHALLRDGIAPGDRVAVLARESLASLTVLFGVAKAGAVCVSINWRLSPEEIAFILEDARPRRVFFDPDFGPGLARASERVEAPLPAVSLSPRDGQVDDLARWCEGVPDDAPALACHPDDVVMQMYTSGTTGHPKGVQLPHRSFFALAQEMESRGDAWIGWTDADVSLLFVPTFHIGGLWWLVRGLSLGSTNIVLKGFEPARILEAIPRYRVTRTCMVPAMMQVLLAEPGCEQTDFSSLRTIVYGGAPIAPPLLERGMKVFGCEFCQIYGMTETGNMAVSLRPSDHLAAGAARLLAAGRPLPGVEVRVLTREGREAAPGEIGEVAIRSPAQMVGYWNRPQETRRTMADGWVRTGDGGYLDGDGFLYVCDRMKDMIICAGENIYPAEIENVLRRHDAVADAAVIGVPDDLWGEAVMAFVVARTGTTVEAREIVRHARRHMADFKVPKTVKVVEQLPRNASGKVLKAKLREPFWAGRVRNVN